jgi:hypothetical protein
MELFDFIKNSGNIIVHCREFEVKKKNNLGIN